MNPGASYDTLHIDGKLLDGSFAEPIFRYIAFIAPHFPPHAFHGRRPDYLTGRISYAILRRD